MIFTRPAAGRTLGFRRGTVGGSADAAIYIREGGIYAEQIRDGNFAYERGYGVLKRLGGFLEYVVPRYVREGKSYLTIAVGCTGGRHRSVVLVNELARRLSAALDHRVAIMHRDVQRGAIMTAIPMVPAEEDD